MGVSRHATLFPAALAAALLLLGPVRSEAAGSEATAWLRWREAWTRLDSIEASARTLSDLVDLDRVRAALLDSLCDAAGGSSSPRAAVPDAPDLVAPPPSPETIGWARRIILDRLFLGEPRPARLLLEEWSPVTARAWNEDGLFTLSAATLLQARGNPGGALAWLEAGPVPADAEPYAAVLATECRIAIGDTVGAALIGAARLTREPALPRWAREPVEEAVVEGSVASGDATRARRLLDELPSAGDRRAFVLPIERRLAVMRGDLRAADSLRWRTVREFPGGRTAERLLRDTISPDGSVDPAVLARGERVRILLAAAEARADADRFRALAQALAASPGSARADSLAIRAARTAWKARDYVGLADRAAIPGSRAGGRFADEWELITARALRNVGRIDSMAAFYRRVARRGSPEDRRTAYWEWAREMEAQRRFVEADTLYGRYLEAGGGDQRVQAMLRRGICRVARGAPERGRSILEVAAAAGTAEEGAAAWFWIYRAELRRGRTFEARAALAKAADTGAGYYARRARSAIALARSPGGPPVDNPEAYWRAVAALGGEGTDVPAPLGLDGDSTATDVDGRAAAELGGQAGDSTAPAPEPLRPDFSRDADAWTAPASLQTISDRLQLFRLAGRTDWAAMAREDLLAAPGLGSGETRVRRLLDLRLPDLAARAAGNLESASMRLRHPFPHAPAVAAASRRFGIAPEWAWAVMRRESLYESAVVSGAGAVGLMQLVSSTAEATARRHNLPAGPLQAPRINLLLGVAHLGDLARAAGGNWPYVLAAYNAGDGPAARWVRPGEDPDLYIEMIGYRETRDYARRVLETFWTCRELLRGSL